MNEATDLTYPPKPDANGTAKKYYRRRAFYFGRHNTPESFILFGEWKKRLIETGEPPEVKTIRIDLEHAAAHSGNHSWREYIWPGFSAFAAVALAVSIATSVLIYSTRSVPKVDGRPLTVEETLFVRGLRHFNAEREILAKDQPTRVADLYAKIKELGPDDGPIHNTDMEF